MSGNDCDYDSITLFAAIKILHSEGHDLLSAISSLVIQCIEDNNSFEGIQQKFRKEYFTDIPEGSLRTILKRLKQKHFVEYGAKFSNVQLKIPEGVQRKAELGNSVSGLRRDFYSLIHDMRRYYAVNNYDLPADLEKELVLFIDQNIGYTSSLLRGCDQSVTSNYAHIASYIANIEKNDSDKFKLLQNIFFGRVYINIIKTRDTYAKNVSLGMTKVYLDTNILLSLLGFHDASYKQQADELLSILRQAQKIEILVFDETVTEARRLLKAADQEFGKYTNNIPVDSLYYRLKRNGHTKESVTILMEQLETRIDSLGIKIVSLPVLNEGSNDYKKISSEISSEAVRLGRPKPCVTLRHDARVLLAVKLLRNNMHSRLFEKSQHLFITPDTVINVVTHSRSKESLVYPLSISVTEIVSTLWIRNIGSDAIATAMIRQSIMAYVRERAISQDLWNKFIIAAEEAVNNKQLTRDDIAVIMSDEETKRILAEKQYDAPQQLVSDNYIKSLRKVRESESRERELAINKVQNVEDYINKKSKKLANCVVKTIAGLLIVIGTLIVGMLIKTFGISDFVNLLTIFSIIIVLFFALFLGVQDKVQWIINVRSNFMMKIESTISKNMHKKILKDDS